MPSYIQERVLFRNDSGAKACPRSRQKMRVAANPNVAKSTPWKCPFCSESFPVKSKVTEHLKQKHNVRQQSVCEICSKCFQTPTGLEMHMISHGGQARYKCTLCGKACSSTTQLEGHMNTHQGLKPHKCTKCGKAYSYSQTLRQHEKICGLKDVL